ncbi:MAG: glutathione S-transferase family protein [Hoeflea sp.]|uniref:glutathione S-transferase family protein n=1 Tax=Hoeflea sp. TaxID=1940281 RepID=UPI001DE7014D|nr:glutathione S-transferase family protein [Hoeflea sp.]MBU4527892.1 glutathione S-transferase family protein [Alphaproteobacteria bacterium]MBU4546073.1 glutathione S-transferase family protein [Alphaproteobacteria bacterium]MBU4553242.1 glutathione S-transferase family protein [Alphaproteobacteria bacterium]MBV1724314.1 glutathione S-transferase family protein [Hoeflea sp.]MBV1759999.1 glutathione S-transferase family protein [Hoeflea sp.]
MLTLYHAPHSRSSRIVRLLDELGVLDQVEIRIVGIARHDGSGGADPANPHPEGKVPLLVHDGVEIWESSAIILYLTELFPDAGLGRPIGHPERGPYLSWLAWYGDVMEPVMVFKLSGLSHPSLDATFRGVDEMTARLSGQLSRTPYILGDAFSAADLLLGSTFVWLPDATPDLPEIRDWMTRCEARPSAARLVAYDQAHSAA